MGQLLRSRKTKLPKNTNEIFDALPAAHIRHLPKPSGVYERDVMQAELDEHRYYLERKVEQRTEQLMKRIALLESCNAALGEKLAQANRDIITLIKQLANTPSGTD